MNTELIIKEVMTRIAERRVRQARLWGALHGLISLGALVALVPAYQYLSHSATASGFSAYLSLMASDGSALAHSWQSFGLTLVESAPIAGCVLVLGILITLAYSARKTASDWGRMDLISIGAVHA
jgi:hypothetical protein